MQEELPPMTTPESPLEVRHVIYHGRVQGVGFRATTAIIARDYPVEGYVKNLPNGTVELLAQGTEESLGRFLTHIATQFRHNISRIEETNTSQPVTQKGFIIV